MVDHFAVAYLKAHPLPESVRFAPVAGRAVEACRYRREPSGPRGHDRARGGGRQAGSGRRLTADSSIPDAVASGSEAWDDGAKLSPTPGGRFRLRKLACRRD